MIPIRELFTRMGKIKFFIIIGIMICGYVHQSLMIQNEYDENRSFYWKLKQKIEDNSTDATCTNETTTKRYEPLTVGSDKARDHDQSLFQYQLSKSTISFGRFFAWGIFCGSVPNLGILRSLGMKYSIGFGITISSVWCMICSLLIQEKIYQMGLMFLSGIGISSLASGIHQMAGQFCKRHERSQYAVLITVYFTGSALADITTFYLVDLLDNKSVFYVNLFILSLWNVCWWKYSIFPEHSLDYLQSDIPWSKIISSSTVTIICLSLFGITWTETVLYVAYIPFMDATYGIDPKMPGSFFDFLPKFGHLVISFFIAFITDKIIGSTRIKITIIRKLAAYVGHLLSASCLFLVTYTGKDPAIPYGLLTTCWILIGISRIGSGACAIDIAPHHSGIIIAIAQMFMALGTIGASYLIEFIIFHNIAGGWHILYGATAGIMTLSGFCFIFGANSNELPWSKIPPNETNQQDELETFNLNPAPCSGSPTSRPTENNIQI